MLTKRLLERLGSKLSAFHGLSCQIFSTTLQDRCHYNLHLQIKENESQEGWFYQARHLRRDNIGSFLCRRLLIVSIRADKAYWDQSQTHLAQLMTQTEGPEDHLPKFSDDSALVVGNTLEERKGTLRVLLTNAKTMISTHTPPHTNYKLLGDVKAMTLTLVEMEKQCQYSNEPRHRSKRPRSHMLPSWIKYMVVLPFLRGSPSFIFSPLAPNFTSHKAMQNSVLFHKPSLFPFCLQTKSKLIPSNKLTPPISINLIPQTSIWILY